MGYTKPVSPKLVCDCVTAEFDTNSWGTPRAVIQLRRTAELITRKWVLRSHPDADIDTSSDDFKLKVVALFSVLCRYIRTFSKRPFAAKAVPNRAGKWRGYTSNILLIEFVVLRKVLNSNTASQLSRKTLISKKSFVTSDHPRQHKSIQIHHQLSHHSSHCLKPTPSPDQIKSL
ncbi:hypothetical protein FJTKL_04466 [Diaporthe vaccinii]|uniref:Uncharacterized protein n=1 Tax=Diaporthe vaccinii TaxID=105482 RepID=A0ABR4DTV0_9PEZI